jgi:hypothetical protein
MPGIQYTKHTIKNQPIKLDYIGRRDNSYWHMSNIGYVMSVTEQMSKDVTYCMYYEYIGSNITAEGVSCGSMETLEEAIIKDIIE